MKRILAWFRGLFLLGAAVAVVAAAGLGLVIYQYSQDLPDYQALADYAPPTVTRVYAGDGRLLAEYARERRVFVPIDAIPDHVRLAFIAAEDQHFYEHFGLDPRGILRAAIGNIERLRNDRRPAGASTITQQVAKNFLLSNTVSIERKIKEAILAWRIERAFTKDHILELYLNEIFLGNRSYGVAAAALNYFDKSLDELSVAEAAFLAGLPQAPSRYDPTRNADAALARRSYVLQRMRDDGYITAAEATEAAAEGLQLRRRGEADTVRADFFTEEVRRQLVARYGERGFYEGGLAVRTTVDPALQRLADEALRRGLANYDRRNGWRGALGNLEVGDDAWPERLAAFDPGFEPGNWRVAIVLGTDGGGAALGFADGSRGTLPFAEMRWARARGAEGRLGAAPRNAAAVVKPGDVIAVEELHEGEGTYLTLRQRPEIEGAVVALDPHTGKVLAMSGGFSFRQSWFNRATQAWRQPGSAFKPFVYLAALEDGYTPSSIVVDGPVEFDQGPGLPKWRPENYSQTFYGPSTLRLGLEKSRNLMTVRLANQIGMGEVLDVAHRFGIDAGLSGNLAESLGAGEVTPLTLATAYAMLVNGGRKVEPYLVDRIQDSRGRSIMRRDARACAACNAVAWSADTLPPDLPDDRQLVTDPRLAYQIVSMLQGVIERGTASAAASLNRPLAGKTGTTNDAKDGWFVGFSPDLVVAVYIGYDQPRTLGDRETGGTLALPIWIDLVGHALADVPRQPFRTPPGLQLVQVDAASGKLAGSSSRQVITEAFLPGTVPTARAGGGSRRDAGSAPLGGLY